MFKLIQAKLLIAILSVLTVIAGSEIYRAQEAHRAAEAATRFAALLEQQRRDAEERRKQYEAFRNQVEERKKHHNVAAGDEGKTWRSYLP